MMSMQDLFYGASEPVFVVKPKTEEEKKKEAAAEKDEKQEEYTILKLIPDYPYWYPPTPAEAKKEVKADDKKETKVTLKVSICCSECVDTLTYSLKELKGVKDVECNIRKERVVVTCTTAAPADVILTARKEFRHARLWTDDD